MSTLSTVKKVYEVCESNLLCSLYEELEYFFNFFFLNQDLFTDACINDHPTKEKIVLPGKSLFVFFLFVVFFFFFFFLVFCRKKLQVKFHKGIGR